MKDAQGKEIQNSIKIHEDNYIEFGNVEYFSLAIDPYHLLTDTVNGFKLTNNIARFTLPLIIVETPAEYPDHDYEQAFFDSSAEILMINSGNNWVPVVLKLENADNPLEQHERIAVHKAFLDALNTEMIQSISPSVIGSEQVIVGHSFVNWDSGKTYINPGKPIWNDPNIISNVHDVVEHCSPERVIGCSIADIEILKIYRETGEQEKGKLLKEATSLDKNTGRPADGDYYLDPKTKKAYFSDSAHPKILPIIQQKLNQNKLTETFDWKIEKNKISKLIVRTEAAPLYAAVKAAQMKYTNLREKSVQEILSSPEIETITFPDRLSADSTANFIKRITGKRPNLRIKQRLPKAP